MPFIAVRAGGTHWPLRQFTGTLATISSNEGDHLVRLNLNSLRPLMPEKTTRGPLTENVISLSIRVFDERQALTTPLGMSSTAAASRYWVAGRYPGFSGRAGLWQRAGSFGRMTLPRAPTEGR